MDAGEGFALISERVGDRLAISIKGDLDFGSAPQLADLVQRAAEDGVACCLLDMTRVTFIDSEAVRALLRLRRMLVGKGGEVKVTACSEYPQRILNLLKVADLLGLPQERESEHP